MLIIFDTILAFFDMEFADWEASSRKGGAELKGLEQKTMPTSEPVQVESVASQVADRAPAQAAKLDKLEPVGSRQSHSSTRSSTQVSVHTWPGSTGSLHTLHHLLELLCTRPAMIHGQAQRKSVWLHALHFLGQKA